MGVKMKILYMSVHEILEYDELKLFAEMGHECYSLGAYTMPGGGENRKRPALELPYNPHFIELATRYGKELHAEMLSDIDMVIIMHEPDFVVNNWPLLKQFIDQSGRVVWRSIGQSIPQVERRLQPFREQGLEVVRYSPAEQTITDNIGCDAMIRFYKDPGEYRDWMGEMTRERVINFTQSLKQRGRFCGYGTIMEATRGFDRVIYGPGNEDLRELNGGLLDNDAQKYALAANRAYIYTGTYPASYTLSFIEAMMTGIPMVCVGAVLGNGDMFREQQTYEVPDIITNGVNGFIADDVDQLREAIAKLMDQPELAKQISAAGRERAIELFGKETVKTAWAEFFSGKSRDNTI